jgi:hypothetical protein
MARHIIYINLSASSTVVSHSSAFNKASCTIVIIQFLTASSFISLSDAEFNIKDSIYSSNINTSCIHILHLYHLLLHSSQPLP